MPVLEGRHNGRHLIVDVVVTEPSYRRSMRTLEGRGLIDTGASASLICRRFTKELALVPIGKKPLVTARGIDLAERYEFRIGFLLTDVCRPPRPFIIDDDLIGSEFYDHANFDVIIGMDVLRTGELLLRRDYGFSFSF